MGEQQSLFFDQVYGEVREKLRPFIYQVAGERIPAGHLSDPAIQGYYRRKIDGWEGPMIHELRLRDVPQEEAGRMLRRLGELSDMQDEVDKLFEAGTTDRARRIEEASETVLDNIMQDPSIKGLIEEGYTADEIVSLIETVHHISKIKVE